MSTRLLIMLSVWVIALPSLLLSEELSVKGVVLIAAKEGKVDFTQNGKSLPAEKTSANSAIGEGVKIATGEDGQVILLFSNGTVSTIGASTTLTLAKFSQEPFANKEGSMGDLTEEPSESSVEIDLDFGSMIVGTKKLNKSSTFNIESALGTAGIRGTEFKIAVPPGGAYALDVAESTVSFTPAGVTNPVPVTAGNGLDLAGAGQPVATRPINPVVAQAITQANSDAFALTANVSLGAVTSMMEEATSEEAEAEGGSDEGGTEDTPDESTPEGEIAPDNSQIMENNPELQEGRKQGEIDDLSKLVLSLELDRLQTDRFYSYPRDIQYALLAETPTTAQRILDLYPPVNLARRLFAYPGTLRLQTLTVLSDELVALALFDDLSSEQLSALLAYETPVQTQILNETGSVARRLMDIDALGGSSAQFFSYEEDIRDRILQVTQDEAVAGLLARGYTGTALALILSDENIVRLNQVTGATPSEPGELPDPALISRISVFVAESYANDNGHLLDQLLEMGSGTLTDELLTIGEEANLLLTDLSFSTTLSSELSPFPLSALSNVFFAEPESVWIALANDYFPGAVPVLLAGRRVTMAAGEYDYHSLLGEKSDTVLLASLFNLEVSGEISFTAGSGTQADRVALVSGGTITVSSGTEITSALADLAMASRGDLSVRDSVLSGNKIYLSSLRDMLLSNVTIEADSLHAQALQTLTVDQLILSEQIRSIHMGATTLNLSNLNFPSAADVTLQSLKGGIEEKYPTFGTSNQAYGRVNFLEKVSSGGNLLFDRSSFDLHGTNIQIQKLP